MVSEAQGISLIPMLPSHFGGTETSGAVDANPVIPVCNLEPRPGVAAPRDS